MDDDDDDDDDDVVVDNDDDDDVDYYDVDDGVCRRRPLSSSWECILFNARRRLPSAVKLHPPPASCGAPHRTAPHTAHRGSLGQGIGHHPQPSTLQPSTLCTVGFR